MKLSQNDHNADAGRGNGIVSRLGQMWSHVTKRPVLWGLAAIVPAGILTAFFLTFSAVKTTDPMVYRVRPMDLVISVLAGGSVATTGALEIKSQVEGSVRIISVIPEGTVLTEQDVQEGRVLMELDSADLRERLTQQNVTVQSSEASFTQARESFEIQKNLNESNVKTAELKEKFARMDLEKYLGAGLAARFNSGEIQADNLRNGGDIEATEKMLKELLLGGGALQQQRKLEAARDLAEEEAKRAAGVLKWSRELNAKGYISASELEADALAEKGKSLDLEQAQIALGIFLQYEFPKQTEQLLSDYREAGKALERERAKARAEIAKAEADLKSKEATYLLQKERLQKLTEQIAACTIRAPRAGMVIYPATGSGRWSQDKIEEGATVRERQVLFTIPDSNSIMVSAKVHETSVNKVKVGQRARIVPDGLPDLELHGTVQKVAVLAEAANQWLSPDLKVYNTNISIENPPPQLKPGMSTQVVIFVDTLPSVLAVPLQALNMVDGKRVCYVRRAAGGEMREVEIGQANDNFVHVVKGLQQDESVLLRMPLTAASSKTNGEGPKAAETDDEKAGKAVPVSKETAVQESAPAEKDVAAAETKSKEAADTAMPSADSDTLPEAVLAKLPEQRREDIKTKWTAATPDERKKMIDGFQRAKSKGGRGAGGKRGETARKSDE